LCRYNCYRLPTRYPGAKVPLLTGRLRALGKLNPIRTADQCVKAIYYILCFCGRTLVLLNYYFRIGRLPGESAMVRHPKIYLSPLNLLVLHPCKKSIWLLVSGCPRLGAGNQQSRNFYNIWASRKLLAQDNAVNSRMQVVFLCRSCGQVVNRFGNLRRSDGVPCKGAESRFQWIQKGLVSTPQPGQKAGQGVITANTIYCGRL
jgi:hypothetical protein